MSFSTKLAIQLEAVDALITEFRKRWDFEEDDDKMIDDFKAALVTKANEEPVVAVKRARKTNKKKADDDVAAEPKAKRAPSAYNLFVQSKKTELVAAGFKGQNLIKEAARLWKERQAVDVAPAAPVVDDDKTSV